MRSRVSAAPVPGFFVQGVVSALRAEGADLGQLTRSVHRELSSADASLLTLPVDDYLAVLEHASQQLGNPALGLSLGQRLSEASLHMLGPIIVASSTLRSALESIAALDAPMLSNSAWRVTEHGKSVFYGPDEHSSDDHWRIHTDLVMTLAFACARRFVGVHHASSLSAHFACAAPSYAAMYRVALSDEVHFDAPRTAICFPRSLLDIPRAGTDPAFAGTLRSLALARFQGTSAEASWTARVESTLRGHAQLAQVDFEQIAAAWQMSARSLRRKVELEGSRLSDVLNRVRFERAQELLKLNPAPLRDIAESLGYAEVSSFQRAFKRWAGVGPGEYRARAATEKLKK